MFSMITESEIRKLVNKVSSCNSFQELALLQKNVLNKIELATSIVGKTKASFRGDLNSSAAKRSRELKERYSISISQFYNKMHARIYNITPPFNSPAITLNQIEREVLGPITELTMLEHQIGRTADVNANSSLSEVAGTRSKLKAEIIEKRAEIERLEKRKEMERRQREALRRAEEKRKKKEREEKKKKGRGVKGCRKKG